jgi:hypothetical protein
VIRFDDAADPPVSALAAIPAAPVSPLVVRPDAHAVLNQRLVRFEQPGPIPRRELLTMMEDLLGRRIEGDNRATLNQPVTVSLSDGTVAELIAQILANTDLQLAITPEAARLQPRAANDAPTIILPR